MTTAADWERWLLEYFRSQQSDVMREIRESGALPDAEKLKESIKSFKERFSPSEETADKEDQEKTEERQEDSAEQKAEAEERFDEEAGPASEADAPAPG